MPRRRNQSVDLTRRYLDAGLRCIKRLGLSATTMDVIAEEAGVKRITLYRKFGSRTNLIRLIVADRFDGFHKRFAARLQSTSALATMIEEYLMFSVQDVLQDPLTRDSLQGKLDFTSPGQPLHDAVKRFWEPLLATARRKGKVDPAMDIDAFAQWILVCQFTFGRLEFEGPLTEEQARSLIRAFVIPAFDQKKGK